MTKIDGPLNNAYFLYVYIRSPKKSSKESFSRKNSENEVSTFSGFVLNYGKCVLVTKKSSVKPKFFGVKDYRVGLT